MEQAKNGDVVKVHYTGKLEDGMVFDTSLDRDPLEFQIGEGRLIPGFEEAVIGMRVGESKTTKVPPERAFGAYHQEKVYVIDRSRFPADVEIGQEFELDQEDNRSKFAAVADISKESVTLDGNHALAGHNLIFEIQLLEVM
jgi:peptidylprolyl isomerase